MKKSDILKKIQDLVNLLEDNLDYEHVEFTIKVTDCKAYQDQKYSYELDT